jgi:hypothetical protein
MKTTTDYNGWKNRQTWNVALHINNDYNLYQSAKEYVKGNPNSKKLYGGFIKWAGLTDSNTPDRIKWNGSKLDYKALNDMIRELIEH